MRMSEKCRNDNNNSDNPLTSRRTDGGKKNWQRLDLSTAYLNKVRFFLKIKFAAKLLLAHC